MIDFLVVQTIVSSILLMALLLASAKLNQWVGARNAYLLWLCLPVSLLLSGVFGLFPQQTWHEVLKYTVFADNPLTSVHSNWSISIQTSLLIIWSIIGFGLLVLFLWQHRAYQRQLAIEESNLSFKGLSVWTSRRCASPQLIGVFHPKIVVPFSFKLQFNASQQRLILQHEYCHWCQKDPIWNFLGIIILSMFWFNPIFWYAFRRFKLQQELACDARVLNAESVAMRKEYAMSMVSVSANADAIHFTQTLYSEKYNMKHRIQQIMQHKKKAILPSVFIAIGLISTSFVSHAVLNNNAKSTEMPLHPIKRVAPEYPTQAATDNIQGWVQLSFNIEMDGTVSDVAIINAEPKWTFETSAIEAVQQWQYQASDSRHTDMKVQLDFQLDNSAQTPEYDEMEIVTVAK